jgi:hypothetical protein
VKAYFFEKIKWKKCEGDLTIAPKSGFLAMPEKTRKT